MSNGGLVLVLACVTGGVLVAMKSAQAEEPVEEPTEEPVEEPSFLAPPDEFTTSYTRRVFKSSFNEELSADFFGTGLLVFDVTHEGKLVLRYRLVDDEKVWMASPAEYAKGDPVYEDAAFNLQIREN